MEPLFWVIAIMGCGEPDACREARIVESRFASAAECRAAIGPVLERSTDLDFPVLRAGCRKAVRRIRG